MQSVGYDNPDCPNQGPRERSDASPLQMRDYCQNGPGASLIIVARLGRRKGKTMRHDDFDREFERTSRLIRYGMVFSGVVTIIVLALIIAAVWAVGRFVGVW